MTSEKGLDCSEDPCEEQSQIVIRTDIVEEDYYELKVCDINLRPICEAKAVTIQSWLDDISSEAKDAESQIDFKAKSLGLDGEPPNPDVFLSSEENFSVVDQLLADDYLPPNEASDILLHLNCLRDLYRSAAINSPMPMQVMLKLDVSAFKLLPLAGHIFADIPERGRSAMVSMGKKRQKGLRMDEILKAYKKIGAQWRDDEPQKLPILILLKDEKEARRISIHELAGEIFKDPQVDVTQRHINNYLKELHEKGEI